ncbi:MAG: sigma-70 family RNA polymerase sigma factor [Candidatus Poribacteria bacterium]|nr:sigma-70 family RNA polymerase sigma factor [Candidatus Poribacteria bacterium]
MEHTDVELIKRTLSGDQDAFTVLVRRYDKRVHALAWRKTGDFHIAEDITQDTFLRAYRNLGTLKNPNLFAGWLYVIANRLCDTWFKRSRPQLQSLEALPTAELEETLYSDFTMKQREKRASEQRIDLVKRLLQRLPESERIVITLHYLAESTIKEISEFLGVSQNTVKSRLYRARQRLQKEDNMLRETLGSFQPTTSLTENIVRVLKETGIPIDSTAPSGNKPLVPWVIATSTFIIIALMLGLGANILARFQQPYSLDATSEMTVDIVDASVMLNLPSNPEVQNQVGNINAPDKSQGTSQNPDAKLSSSASGKIVDEVGNPVNDVRIAVMPVEYIKGGWYPKDVDEDSRWPDDPLAFPAHANKDGNFVINSFDQGTVLLGVLPYYKPEYQIVKVKIGGMNFYSVKEIWGGILLAPEPGKEIKNVEVTVRHFLKVHGKVQEVNGTAVSNVRLEFEVTQLSLDREGPILESSRGFGVRTDVKGNFEKFVPNYTNGTAFYIMSIKYQERIAMSKPVVIKHGDRTHEAVFTFNEPLIPSPPEDVKRENQTSASGNSGVDAVGVWVVNPENGHAYKKIRCDSPEDAMVQATDEGTHLVTINNEAEEKWLRKVFNTNGILIGLNDIEVEGQWQWRNGEPVEYTNWDKFEPKDTDNGDEDYVVLTSQGWKDIGEESIGWRWIRTALLEKDNWSIDK